MIITRFHSYNDAVSYPCDHVFVQNQVYGIGLAGMYFHISLNFTIILIDAAVYL